MWVVMSVFLLGMVCTAAGETIYVDADASGVNNGSSWADAYNYLQDALVAATSGDQIWVAQGTYTPDCNSDDPDGSGDRTATFQLINGVALKGGYAGSGEPDPDARDIEAYETILSGDLNGDDVGFTNNGENSYQVVTGSGTNATAVLDGFTITAGNANGLGTYGYGAGMYNDQGSPTLTNCTFSGNSAKRGGGMSNNYYSSPTVTNCTFSGNEAWWTGGGMYNTNSSPTVTNCTFSGNTLTSTYGGFGGGMCNWGSSPTVTNCTFSGNSALGRPGGGGGGGMYNNGGSPTVTNCTFSRNYAWQGGGMVNFYFSSATVTNCTFSGNAAGWVGGMYTAGRSSSTLSNCILWGNSALSESEIYGSQIYNDSGSSATVRYSDIQGGWPGEGNIDVDPLFADPNNGDYHLKSEAGRWDSNGETWVMDDVTSPCIDAGDPAADYSREPLPNGLCINMGAYGNTPEASKSPSLSETSSVESALVETVMGQQAVLENVTVTGDFDSVLNFTNFDIVTITTGPWAGKGFSKGQWQTILDGIPYQGDWKGVLFLRLDERKIYLKGAISGEIFATVEGYLSESVPESGVYEQYQATWKVGRLGATTTSATLNLNGNLSYQSSSEFPATELYVLQTNVEGTVSGDYTGPLSTVVNHVRIADGNNPFFGEGFSIISNVAGSGSGQGWTYDKLVSPGRVELKGLFSSPLFGVVSGTLDESEQARTLFLKVERVDLGLPPVPDPKVEIWGPRRVSPGQTISFVIELRNDGLAEGKNYSVITKLPEYSKFTYATEGYKFYSIADWDENDNYRPVPVVRRDISTVSPKTYLNLAAQTELFFGVTTPQTAEVYILPKEKADEIFPVYDPEGDKGNDITFAKSSLDGQVRPTIEMDWPTDGRFITQHFEDPSNPDHKGLDVNLEIGDEVRAATDGIVIAVVGNADNDRDPMTGSSWGNYVIIDHGAGVHTLYGHLDKVDVSVGQEIYQGATKIGTGGNTGHVKPKKDDQGNFITDGSHLHFEVRTNCTAGVPLTGTTVDPEEWLFNRPNVQPDLDDNSITDSTAGIGFVTARDPSVKYGPEGRVSPGQRLDYRVEYENEGEGIAFGVYFTDTLDEDLDDSTLEIGLVIDVNDGSIVGEPGIYNPATRTITWFAGEVGPGQGGFADFSVNVRADANDGTEIINYATIYFPSVPEETRTNGIVSIVSLNQPPVADAGPDQTVEQSSATGAEVKLDGSDSNDPDGDALTYEWTWDGGSAVGVNPTVILPPGLTTVTLTVSDGQLSDTDTVDINVVDTTPPEVEVIVPQANAALQDGVTLTAEASDISGVTEVYFYIREPDDGNGVAIGYEDLPGTLNITSGKWEYPFDTTLLLDGYYVILAKGIDTCGNEGWSEVVPFSIRNWAVIELLPASESNKAGRTMPVKFSLRIVESVDPAMPFVYNEGLEIRIYDAAEPANILQTSVYGDGARNYRIDSIEELYITNFRTKKQPAQYVVEIWRISKNFLVGSFTFETVK